MVLSASLTSLAALASSARRKGQTQNQKRAQLCMWDIGRPRDMSFYEELARADLLSRCSLLSPHSHGAHTHVSSTLFGSVFDADEAQH
jgi:hypothetical protein